jgi:hypothetical protein
VLGLRGPSGVVDICLWSAELWWNVTYYTDLTYLTVSTDYRSGRTPQAHCVHGGWQEVGLRGELGW